MKERLSAPDRMRDARRGAAPVTLQRLQNAAAAYVARYDTSSAGLRAVLMRRLLKARRHGAAVLDDAETAIDAIVARYLKSGIIDDLRFAERKADRLHRRGASTRHIREKLKVAGLDRDIADRALDAMRSEGTESAADLDLRAAVALARRRRLGPFRAPAQRSGYRARDLAVLGRAGFAFELARQVIDADDGEGLLAQDRLP